MSAAAGYTKERSAPIIKCGAVFTAPNHGQQPVLWRNNPESTERKYSFRVVWPANGDAELKLQLRNEQRAVIYTWNIPHPTHKFHVFLEDGNVTLEIQEMNGSDGVLLCKLVVCFDQDRASRENVRQIFLAVQRVVERLPDSQVPYFNLGFKRPVEMQSRRSACVRYNLRQLALALPNEFGQPWGVYMPAIQVQIKLIRHLAHPVVRKALAYWTGGKIPAFFCKPLRITPLQTSTTTVPLAIVQDDRPSTIAEPSGAMSYPRACAKCHEDESPLGIGAIKNKRLRNKWVGCTKGEQCLSDNYWFHFKCCDAEVAMMNQLGKSRQWVCEKCRVGWADGKLRDGTYAKI